LIEVFVILLINAPENTDLSGHLNCVGITIYSKQEKETDLEGDMILFEISKEPLYLITRPDPVPMFLL